MSLNRRILKCGGCRRKKALFGADGAINAAATLAAAAMQVAATEKASKQQSKAILDNAKSEASAIATRNENDIKLQKDNIQFQKEQNNLLRQQQTDIQMTLQALAGQNNMNNRMNASKVMVKCGGKRRMKNAGGSSTGDLFRNFEVTDGGGVIPLYSDANGNTLYQIYGNDHEHYHKTSKGKAKTGVGIKFGNGNIVEGEGDQNTGFGELLYTTPSNAYFISKHNLAGFNPAASVLRGMNPMDAFNVQENIKNRIGLNDDGTSKRRKADTGTKVNPYTGAYVIGAANLLGSLATGIAAFAGGNRLANANRESARILSNAYSNLQTIDPNLVNREDYMTTPVMASVVSSDINSNAKIERLRRDRESMLRASNNSIGSGAARQLRGLSVNDRYYQAMGEIADEDNKLRRQIQSENASRIQTASSENAKNFIKATNNYTTNRLTLAKYNNDIVNQRILGSANALSDGNLAATEASTTGLNSLVTNIGTGITNAAAGFASAYDANRTNRLSLSNALIGASNDDKVEALINFGDANLAEQYYNKFVEQGDINNANILKNRFGFLRKAKNFKGLSLDTSFKERSLVAPTRFSPINLNLI